MSNNIIHYDFKSGLPLEIEIVDIRELYKQAKESLTSLHRADFYHIIWFEEGFPTHNLDFKPIDIKPNSLLFLPKGIVHSFDAEVPFKAKAILFTDAFFGQQADDIQFLRQRILFNDLFEVAHLQLTTPDPYASIWKLITEELAREKDSNQAIIVKNLLSSFLLYAERAFKSQAKKELQPSQDLQLVLRFRDLLEVNFKTHKLVSYYAQNCYVTEKKLNAATSRILGKTPKQLIDERVLLEAKRLLAYSKETVKEISFSLGFEEPTNFIKYFKKHSKLRPVEFRVQLNAV